MNTVRKSILIGMTVLGLAGASTAALADDAAAGRHGWQANSEQRQARMADMFAKHQAKLHDLLKLTAAQEPAWTAYQNAIKPALPAEHIDHAAMAKLPAPERLARMIDMSKQRTLAMEGHLGALNTFYGQLTTEQKAIFDDHVMGGAHGPHRMMGHRHE
ncbi:Spy/CpxP family protein refolding chaperone [Rugamonas apoptosis]|uniref:Spy/CpxP family protein refolding chaperone n=1 Tax=Rugamonas apoptosis TaxID=2758570 RepID=A0A7W2IIC6_9BURK|nr:Spy/CpxP family protein refolding chaperone [Rugamonas apoptosis]MBA5685575.1 Spy/CpxP family protein refolding chaperone [Rugamonas apoptosis]